MNAPYRPIDCSVHDEFELRAVRRVRCELDYLDETGAKQHRSGRIVDLTTRNGEEYLRLDDGTEVRLDRVIRVDGRRLG